MIWTQTHLLSSFPFPPCFSSGCKVGGSCGPGAHLPFRPADGPQDDDARGGPCGPGEAAAAGATPHPATAADPEAAPDCRISEAARELDPAAPGPASGAHQGSKCVPASDLCTQGALGGRWSTEGMVPCCLHMQVGLGGNGGCTGGNLGKC